MAREGVPLPVIQRQLGHAHLGVTSTYLQGIDALKSSTQSMPAATDDPGERWSSTVSHCLLVRLQD
jgi:integrase